MDRRIPTRLGAVLMLAALSALTPARAHENHVHETPADGFSADEVAAIRAWFRAHPDPGLAGDHGLPEGLLARLVPDNVLIAGVPRRRLPEPLLEALPPPHPGYERLLVGDRVLLVDAGSNRIIDLIIAPGR